MTAVFNSLMILIFFLALAVFGFKTDQTVIVIPSLMISGYMVAVFIDYFIDAWEK